LETGLTIHDRRHQNHHEHLLSGQTGNEDFDLLSGGRGWMMQEACIDWPHKVDGSYKDLINAIQQSKHYDFQ
jgi:hypothetical protein